MKELPSHLVSEDFYIWFNIKEKEEYYSTPLYLYNVLRKDTDKENDEEKRRGASLFLRPRRRAARHILTLHGNILSHLDSITKK